MIKEASQSCSFVRPVGVVREPPEIKALLEAASTLGTREVAIPRQLPSDLPAAL